MGDRLVAWFSSGYDMQGVHRKFSEGIVTKSDDDKRRIFVRGFPWNAKEDAVSRYFGKRSGEVESVKMINWSRDGRPSGRSVVTFTDEESVENAIKLHRNKMGSRWLEVYRVNQGDREEVHAVEKSLHGALIGIKGAVVQEMQAESGACIIFETEPEDRMVIKGRDHERAKAWAMAQAIISDNEMQSHKVDQSLHGRLIGAKGTLKKMMELESGAHIVYRAEPEPCCMIYGNQAARERAWQLVSGKIWDLQHSSEEYYPLDKKFHGTLVGKGSVVVRAWKSAQARGSALSPAKARARVQRKMDRMGLWRTKTVVPWLCVGPSSSAGLRGSSHRSCCASCRRCSASCVTRTSHWGRCGRSLCRLSRYGRRPLTRRSTRPRPRQRQARPPSRTRQTVRLNLL